MTMIDEIWVWIALLLAAVGVWWAWSRTRSLTRRRDPGQPDRETDRRSDGLPPPTSITDQAQAEEARQLAQAEAQAKRRAAELEAVQRARQAEHARRDAEAEQARRTDAAEAARRDAELEVQRREQAARLARQAAQAEADRLAAEARAARQAADAEAKRLAEEAQAARLAAQAEAARLAAEIEAARLAAEAEVARAAAEQEAARVAAEAEVARAAAEQEAARLALEEAQRASAAMPLAPVNRPASAGTTLVMVADDSKVVRVKTSRLLTQHGYRVALAEDGADAARKIAAEAPHVLITDVDMPGMDGFELTRLVRGNPSTADILVIMITAADDRHAARASEVGVSVLLGKPYPEEKLMAHLASARAAGALA